jgi:hypothetical protein
VKDFEILRAADDLWPKCAALSHLASTNLNAQSTILDPGVVHSFGVF